MSYLINSVATTVIFKHLLLNNNLNTGMQPYHII